MLYDIFCAQLKKKKLMFQESSKWNTMLECDILLASTRF